MVQGVLAYVMYCIMWCRAVVPTLVHKSYRALSVAGAVSVVRANQSSGPGSPVRLQPSTVTVSVLQLCVVEQATHRDVCLDCNNSPEWWLIEM